MSDLVNTVRMAPLTSGADFRVLVVDDDPDMRAFLVHLLRGEKMRIETVADGEQALERVAAQPPDLILLDIMLPGISGFDVCQKLKSDEATALIPIVLITALEDQASRVRGIEAGADDFLSKPVRREELLARMNTLRRLHETRRELEARHLAAEVQRKEALRKTFSRYVSPRLAERIVREHPEGEDVFRDLGERAAVVALFADLRGFTRLSELVPVSLIVPMLNEFFSELTAAVHDHEGTVFGMAGDSMLVGFNIPVPQDDAAERALATGRGMIERFAPIAQRWKVQHKVQVGIGVGIEAGEVVAGNVGSPTFMAYTIIGDAVNVAARLMQSAAADEILIGPRAYLSLRGMLGASAARYRREMTLRGRSEPVEVLALQVTRQ